MISTVVDGIVDGALALDTLNEIAAAIADDANIATTLTTAISTEARLVRKQQNKRTQQQSQQLTHPVLQRTQQQSRAIEIPEMQEVGIWIITEEVEIRLETIMLPPQQSKTSGLKWQHATPPSRRNLILQKLLCLSA